MIKFIFFYVKQIFFSEIVNEGLMEKLDCKDPIFLEIYETKLLNLVLIGDINADKLVNSLIFFFKILNIKIMFA